MRMDDDFTRVLRHHAAQRPAKPALCFIPTGEVTASLTYPELMAAAAEFAGALQRCTRRQARVLLMLPTGFDYVTLFCGCVEADRVAVPLFPPPAQPPRYVDRTRGVAASAQPELIVCEPEAKPRALALVAELQLDCKVMTPAELRAGSGPVEPAAAGDRLAFLQYTSGSTRAPKGVMVRTSALLANLRAMQAAFRLTTDDTMVTWLPLFHDMGLIGAVLSALHCGMTAYLMPTASFVRSPRRWLDAISRYRGTISPAPDFAYSLCTRMLDDATVASLDLRSWAMAISGGEPVHAETLRAFSAKFAAAGFSPEALAPSFGQAEATLCVSGSRSGHPPRSLRVSRSALAEHRIHLAAGEDALELVACGPVVAEHEVAIVDPERHVHCAPDQVGELWIAGPSMARGYFGELEATHQTFRARIAGDVRAREWVRSGDLGFVHEGELIVCGRLKDLIILGGRNVVPHDLEQAVSLAAPELRSSRVVAVSHWDAALGREALVLVAECSSHAARAPALFQRMQAAAREVADCAIDRIVLVKPRGIPLTTSGKLSRQLTKALLEGGKLPVVSDSAQCAFAGQERTDPERWLHWFAAQLAQLGAEKSLDAERSLLEQGFDSLALTALQSALAEQGVPLSLSALFEAPTLGALASRVASMEAAPQAPAPPRARGGAAPLSRAQQRLWFLHELDPNRCDHNLVATLSLHGPLDRNALERSLEWLVARHAILRTRYRTRPDGPESLVDPPAPYALRTTAADPAALDAAVARELRTPFRLHEPSQGPSALRAELFDHGAGRHTLLLSLHHLACDGHSAGVLVQGLAAAYAAAVSGRQLPPTDGPQYAEYAWNERALERSEELAAGSAFFRDYLAGYAAELGPARSGDNAERRFALTPADCAAVAAHARRHGSTPFLVLLALYGVVLRQLTGRERLVVGTDVEGRSRPGARGVVGFFVNQLALRCDVSGELALGEVIARQRADALRAYAHEAVPFDAVVSSLAGTRDRGAAALFRVKLNYRPAPVRERRIGELSIGALRVHQARGMFDLVLDLVREPDGGLQAVLEHDPALGSLAARLEALWSSLVRDLDRFVDAPLATVLAELSRLEHTLQLTAARHELASERAQLFRSRRRPSNPVEES